MSNDQNLLSDIRNEEELYQYLYKINHYVSSGKFNKKVADISNDTKIPERKIAQNFLQKISTELIKIMPTIFQDSNACGENLQLYMYLNKFLLSKSYSEILQNRSSISGDSVDEIDQFFKFRIIIRLLELRQDDVPISITYKDDNYDFIEREFYEYVNIQKNNSCIEKSNKVETKDCENNLAQTLKYIIEDPSIPEVEKIKIIIHGTSLLCALVAVQPLPFADVFILTPLQVIMVTFMSKVMGNPVGKQGAGELVASVAGVVGWGVLAQQVILGLYKTVIPFLGGFTTIPLVYSATVGLGYATKAILDARRKDQKLTNDEIKEIKNKYEKEAKEEKKQWSLNTIKGEYNDLVNRANEYKIYKLEVENYTKSIEELIKEKQEIEEVLKSSQTKASIHESDYAELSDKIYCENKEFIDEIIDENNKKDIELRNNSKLIEQLQTEITKIKKQHEGNEIELQKYRNKKIKSLRERYEKKYKNISFGRKVFDYLSSVDSDTTYNSEEKIGKINDKSGLAGYKCRVEGVEPAVYEVEFEKASRMYVRREGNKTIIYTAGSKKTQKLDIEWLKKDARNINL